MKTERKDLNRMMMMGVVLFVSKALDIPVADIMSKQRRWNILDARQLCFFLIVQTVPRLSISEIGRFFDTSHSTISHGFRKIEDMLAIGDYTTQLKYADCLNELKKYTL